MWRQRSGFTGLSLVPVFYIDLSSASRLAMAGSDLVQIRTRGRLLAPQPSEPRWQDSDCPHVTDSQMSRSHKRRCVPEAAASAPPRASAFERSLAVSTNGLVHEYQHLTPELRELTVNLKATERFRAKRTRKDQL